MQILHIAFFFQLTLLKYILRVFGDNRAFPAEKIAKLGLAQPDLDAPVGGCYR